jgi:hypothetical protein
MLSRGVMWWPLRLTIFAFLVAGAAGGIIASNIPHYTRFETFVSAQLRFLWFEWGTYECWTHVEHGAFWIGILVGAGSLLLKK